MRPSCSAIRYSSAIPFRSPTVHAGDPRPDHARGHPYGNRPCRYRVAHDRAGADDRTIANSHAVEDLRTGAEPRAVADRRVAPGRFGDPGGQRAGEVDAVR